VLLQEEPSFGAVQTEITLGNGIRPVYVPLPEPTPYSDKEISSFAQVMWADVINQEFANE